MVEGLRRPDAGEVAAARRAHLAAQPAAAAPDRRPAAGVGVLRAAHRPRADPHLRRPCTASRPPGPTRGWSGSASTDKAGTRTEKLSGGQRSGSRSPARWCTTPRWCSSTSPPPALDPQARRNLWDLLRSLNDAGRTVVLTTHYMDEAETLCDRVAIMDHGRILRLDSPAALVRGLDAPVRILVARSCCPPTRPGSSPASRRSRSRAAVVLTTRPRPPCSPGWPSWTPSRGSRSGGDPRGRVPRPHRPRVPRVTGPSGRIAVAIVKGFLRDRMSVFFAVVFPLMFLVLFGGCLQRPVQPPDRPRRGRPRGAARPPRPGRAGGVPRDLRRSPTSADLAAALAAGPQGRRRRGGGDAGRHPGRALHADRPGARRRSPRAPWTRSSTAPTRPPPGSRRATRCAPSAVEDRSLKTIQFVTPRPARLGGRDERGVRRRGDAAGLAQQQAAAAPPALPGAGRVGGRRPGRGDDAGSPWCRRRSSSGWGWRPSACG